METKCIMNCHACTVQDGYENKAMCSQLLSMAMMNKLWDKIEELGIKMETLAVTVEEMKECDKPTVQLKKVNFEGVLTEKTETDENDDASDLQ